jgi:tetratricopeptide (TPR) repeat protein
MKAAALAGWLLAGGGQAMALDVNSMWDYERPGLSEQRFREALTEASGDDALVLRTQIARTYSLRGRIDQAHAELDAIEPQVAAAGAEVQVRVLLERGRTLRSARQPAEARPLFVSAFERADAAGLEYLAGDALHMVALVESSLEGQVEWNQRTAQYASRASDPAARHWEAGAWNNLGVALNEAGRHAEALAAFEHALAAHERSGKVTSIRIAHWMVAQPCACSGASMKRWRGSSNSKRNGGRRAKPTPTCSRNWWRCTRRRGTDHAPPATAACWSRPGVNRP